ncbi:hypothetical protein SAMN06295945_1919 [Polynucleobacter meluiroseus]|uniref:MetA-pathway of phenol degradation n=1 Tax=Polynucleobacter meluiroseus TaxID=1938814 RepID=A0A240E4T2_9BURK|nr:hypothetical protein [Polynucleobacter meluiroseus]SNX29541.1 hypothetical protein SAMN06295945_1919 [Polynucleobacter meluiroseus]
MPKTPLLIALVLLPLTCLAFEPLNTDDAATVVRDGNQIELYAFHINNHTNSGAPVENVLTPGEEFLGGQDARALPFTYTRGLSDTVEASIGTTYFKQPNGNYSRFANKVISVKWRFAEASDAQWAFAVKPILSLPSTTQQQIGGLGYAALNYGGGLIGSLYFDPFDIHVNASYMRSPYNINYAVNQSYDTNRTNIYFLSVAPVWKILPGLKLALDMGLNTNPPTTEQYLLNYALIAVIISPLDSVDIGLSYLRSAANMGILSSGLGPYATRTEVGLTWRF